MKSGIKILSTLALATVGASLANAQAAALGYGYANAQYYESNYGLYYTTESSNYSGLYSFATGDSYTIDEFGGSLPNPNHGSYAIGESVAYPAVGNSWAYGTAYNENYVTISNLSNYYDTLIINVQTYGLGEAYSASWQSIGYAWGGGVFEDSYGLIFQESFGEAAAQGLGYQSFWAWSNYDTNYGGSYAFGYYPPIFPQLLYAYAYDTETYYLTFAPGASDTFYTEGFDTHSAYATTPGPTALAPFALGLVGALRRRMKKA